MAPDVYFRAGVGLLIRNDIGLVLALERSDMSDSWQAPQGGLLEGEEPYQAAKRELFEETGIRWDSVTVLAEHPDWLAYELPLAAQSNKTGRGQVQKWFLLEFLGSSGQITLQTNPLDREFARWQWITMADLVSIVWPVRRPIYEALATHWQEHLA
jgi:putative (di)nucleoside polyphosphate hydrolase